MWKKFKFYILFQLYEVAKNDLEERLQKTTEKLNKDLEDLGPSLMSLSNMDDTAKIFEYVQVKCFNLISLFFSFF